MHVFTLLQTIIVFTFFFLTKIGCVVLEGSYYLPND
jgi:hypothetical protein